MRLAALQISNDAWLGLSKLIARLGISYVKFGNQLLIYASDSDWNQVNERVRSEGFILREYPYSIERENLRLVIQIGRFFQEKQPEIPVILDTGRYLAVDLSTERASKIRAQERCCYAIRTLKDNQVIFDTKVPPTPRPAPDPQIQALIDQLSRSNLQDWLTELVNVAPTRYSTTRGYLLAADWATKKLSELGYSPQEESISVIENSGPLRPSLNVVADKPGSGSGQRGLVIVGAHLDSINSKKQPNGDAPGADDDGSGCVGLLEMARLLKNYPNQHDLRFILFGGEEENRSGSKQHIEVLKAAGDLQRIRAVVIMDMIGRMNIPSHLGVLIEGCTVSRPVIDGLLAAASTYALGLQAIQINKCCPYPSDHKFFIDAGCPAALTIERSGRDASGHVHVNPHIHTPNDRLDDISYDLMLEIVRMNTAFVAQTVGHA